MSAVGRRRARSAPITLPEEAASRLRDLHEAARRTYGGGLLTRESREFAAYAASLYTAGWPTPSIAAPCGLTRGSLHRRIQRHLQEHPVPSVPPAPRRGGAR